MIYMCAVCRYIAENTNKQIGRIELQYFLWSNGGLTCSVNRTPLRRGELKECFLAPDVLKGLRSTLEAESVSAVEMSSLETSSILNESFLRRIARHFMVLWS